MKKSLIALSTIVATVAPIVSVVACGNHKKTISEKSTGDTGTTRTVVEGQGPLSEELNTPFTPESLKAKAIEENDNTFWNGGLLYHAFSQTFSILKGLAHEYGYDEKNPVTNLSPKEEFLKKTGGQVITDNDLTINPNDSADIKILKQIKSTGATSSKTPSASGGGQDDLMLRLLDFYGRGGFTKEHILTDFTTAIKYEGTHESVADVETGKNPDDGTPIMTPIDELYLKAFDVYNDPDVPTQLILEIEDSDPVPNNYDLKALREIKLPNMSQMYPIIQERDYFEKLIAPAVKDAFSKIIQLLDDTTVKSIITFVGGVNSQLLFDEIDYLKNKFFTTTTTTTSDETVTTYTPTPEFSSQSFVDKLWKLNNGSAHWLALEVLEKGLSADFTAGKMYEWLFEGNEDMVNKATQSDPVIGFASVDLSGEKISIAQQVLLPWTSFSERITKSSFYQNRDILAIDKDANLAPTLSYGFDVAGLEKSFNRINTQTYAKRTS